MKQIDRPFFVAGPCSAESREQLREVTEALKTIAQVKFIRVGVWKPRSRPGGFEGIGEPALAWMQQLTEEFGVSYCCEVARPEQAELCLRYGIKHVWLGARTTTNPFMVEDLCSAMRGTDMSVMVKNPVCPDVRLWIGAIERLQQVGIEHVMAIHRGFSMYDNQGYRNAPLWEVPLELRREMPDLPILCDPSHIGGRRDLVEKLATAAMQLDYDGLMVEVHPHPDEALTDAQQQITPTALASLTKRWHTGHPKVNGNLEATLSPMRHRIDEIDHDVINLLAQRMECSRSIAAIKHDAGMPVYQPSRWADVVRDRLRAAQVLGLDEAFVKEMMEKIHAESVRVQLAER